MVLEDVNNPAPDGFSDNPYPDQNDRYAASSSASPIDRFDSSNMPRPFPIIGTFIGFSDRAVRFKVEQTLKFAEKKVGRQLHSEEAQALASHIYELEQVKSYFAATGVAAGTWQAYRTMSTNRYPFYRPKPEDINPNKFGPIRGPMATFARHTWRFTLYVLVAGNMGSLIGQLIAQPVAALHSSEDPKLEQFGRELKAAATVERSQNTSQAQEIQERRREFERQTRERSGMGPSPQARWGKQPAQSEDDMSPTSGNEAWGSQSSSSGSWDTFSSQTEQDASQRSRDPSSSNKSNRRAPPASRSTFEDDDDASPTGGLFRDDVNTKSQPQPQSRAGESRWERIRRGEAPIPERRRAELEHQGQREGPSSDDPFAFGDGDDGRRRARDRAMRERASRLAREGQDEDEKRW